MLADHVREYLWQSGRSELILFGRFACSVGLSQCFSNAIDGSLKRFRFLGCQTNSAGVPVAIRCQLVKLKSDNNGFNEFLLDTFFLSQFKECLSQIL